MTRIEEKKVYVCEICETKYTDPEKARQCNFGHDIVYLPIERSDLKRLVQFIQTGEERLLTQSLIKLILKYGNMRPE